MITRHELLEKLRSMIMTEEEIIPIYSRHLNNALFLSEFSLAEQKDIRSKLQMLIVQSQQHKRTFENLIQKIEAEDRDVY